MKFEAVIGLEIHAQISTKTKMFCRCDNDSFNKDPNINVCPVCMGFPGQLPVTNREAVLKGVKAALALNCEIPEYCKFDRKNYFYPDSPKGFQISQFDEPVSKNGYIEIELNENDKKISKRIGITRLHLEDDAGKLMHVRNGTLCDFNRAGTPLMEIVSEPDLRNAEEAEIYARDVQKILRYVGSSEADMEKGMMRFDASVSIREKGQDKLNPRAEIKNLNSFKALNSAISYEIKRQIKLYEDGSPLTVLQTVGWNDEKKETFFMREKEASDDYRYFPEPDIPPLHLAKDLIESLRCDIPEMPAIKQKRYIDEYKLSEEDAKLLVSDINLSDFFEKTAELSGDPRKSCSFITTVLMKYLNEELITVDQQKITPTMMAEMIQMINNGQVSNNQAKTIIFDEMLQTGKSPSTIVEEKGLKQVSDSKELTDICKRIIKDNPDTVLDIAGGKEKAAGFLVGKVMKETKGQANPQLVNEIITKLIKES